MNEEFNTVLYTADEMELLEEHIAKAFGEFDSVMHEIISPDIHVDICVINPSETRHYYTLVTMGMGAHRMNVPSEIPEQARAELCIYLPQDWDIQGSEEEHYWPMRWLKILARLPIENDTWLGQYHTIPCGQPLADNTDLCGFILDTPFTLIDDGDILELPNGEQINFYAIAPLHEAEMSYKVDNGAEALLDMFDDADIDHLLVDIDRESAVDEETVQEGVIDSAHYHTYAIMSKGLDVDNMAGYNHLAIYLRWFIENDMMHEQFYELYPEVVEAVKSGDKSLDLRVFLHQEFDGRLLIQLFSEEGMDFTLHYYAGDEDQYPDDIDSYADMYFEGSDDDLQDEEYLFIPYDEAYYQAMKEYIDRAYSRFLEEV